MSQLARRGAYSLKRRLVLVVVIAAVCVWTILGFTIHRAVLRTSAYEFDERLVQQARVVLAYANHEYLENDTVASNNADASSSDEALDIVYQIWRDDGQLIYRSAGAPAEHLAQLTHQGFDDVSVGAATWRVYSLRSQQNPLAVQVAEPAEHRALIASRVLDAVMLPVLLALPMLGVLIYVVTNAALRPIRRFADDIGMRQPGDLVAFPTERLPDETYALGKALNDLLIRQSDALTRESRFTADAAHELRTPLAAVRVQAQVAQKVARTGTPDEVFNSLNKLIAGVDRAHRLVTQLLSLARLEQRAPTTITATEQPIGAVIDSVMHDLQSLAERNGVLINVGTMPGIAVPEEPLYLLTRNLVDNALRHSPHGTAVSIECQATSDQLTLKISDQGPGLAEELQQRVLGRFYRGTQSYDGNGLGLSIVSRVVQQLHGRIAMDDANAGSGLCVSIVIPLPIRAC